MDTGGSQPQMIAENKGSLLFTHFGFSGPAILNVSRAINSHEPSRQLFLQLDFVCRGTTEQFSSELRQQLQAQGRSSIANLAIEDVPRRLMRFLLGRANIPPETRAAELSREQANRLTGELKSASFPISGTLGFEKAEVTAGGINLQEIHSKTMESKVCPGLFLAGEVIDIDGPIGGYNFQAAFSTGWLAGQNA